MKRLLCLFIALTVSSIASARTMDSVLAAINPYEKALNLVYNPDDGGLRLVLNSGESDSPMKMLTSLQINSSGGDFGGTKPTNLSGTFDVFRSDRMFKMDTSGFGPSIDFGTPMMSGRTADDLMHSISVAGSFIGGGSLEQLPFRLIHPAAVPEPGDLTLLVVGLLGLFRRRRNTDVRSTLTHTEIYTSRVGDSGHR